MPRHPQSVRVELTPRQAELLLILLAHRSDLYVWHKKQEEAFVRIEAALEKARFPVERATPAEASVAGGASACSEQDSAEGTS